MQVQVLPLEPIFGPAMCSVRYKAAPLAVLLCYNISNRGKCLVDRALKGLLDRFESYDLLHEKKPKVHGLFCAIMWLILDTARFRKMRLIL